MANDCCKIHEINVYMCTFLFVLWWCDECIVGALWGCSKNKDGGTYVHIKVLVLLLAVALAMLTLSIGTAAQRLQKCDKGKISRWNNDTLFACEYSCNTGFVNEYSQVLGVNKCVLKNPFNAHISMTSFQGEVFQADSIFYWSWCNRLRLLRFVDCKSNL